jgi:hypothetical protein
MAVGGELLREFVPVLRRLAIIANAGNPGNLLEMGEARTAAIARRACCFRGFHRD